MRYVWNGQNWVTVRERNHDFGAPAVISDHMEPLLHPVSGEIIDSKSRFRAVTRENGCVELGNDAPMAQNRPPSDRKELREDIRRAIWELENGRQAPVARGEGGVSRRYG